MPALQTDHEDQPSVTDYNRGFYDGVAAALNLINATEENSAKDYRKSLYRGLMELRPKKLS